MGRAGAAEQAVLGNHRQDRTEGVRAVFCATGGPRIDLDSRSIREPGLLLSQIFSKLSAARLKCEVPAACCGFTRSRSVRESPSRC